MTGQAAPSLQGLKVLDLSRVLAGPWCTMTLGDLGADVVKVEQPGRGDDTRHWGPPYAGAESAYFLAANRNKRSVELDLGHDKTALEALSASCDVIVENFRAGTLDKFGLDYASVRARNPGVIYCSISGYGHDSPLAARPGYDYVIQAEGGLMAVTGEIDRDPMKVGVAVVDLFTGMAAVQAILAAVIARDRDGLGQHIDLALYDCQLAMLANVGSAYLVSGQEPARYGNGHPTTVPYQTFQTRDRQVVVAVGNDRQFGLLCTQVLGRSDLVDDARFQTNSARVRNRTALIDELVPIFLGNTSAVWLERMRAIGVPCGAVRSVGDALNAPEAVARDMVTTVKHQTEGDIALIASPLRLSRTPVVEPAAPPKLGQHSSEVDAIVQAWRRS